MPKEIEAKTVLNKTKRRDPWFLDDYTFNPYSSCAFNCLYCYIRGSKYGTNLEKTLSAKINAPEILDRQLATHAKKGRHGIIVISSATDPYLRIEEKYQITRQALEIILKHKFPVHIITKSDLIERDFDLLEEIDKTAILPKDLSGLNRGTIISFSFSTLQDHVAGIFEPGAPPPSKRLKAVEECIQHRFLTGVSLMPLLPYISDTGEQLRHYFETFKNLNVNHIFPATITLFGKGNTSSKTLVMNAIKKHFPELLEKYEQFFAQSDQMPTYYQKAFKKKMQQLLKEYDLKDNIR
ncbi:MAG: radical SAM protein [Bacteroidota bacterium]